MDLKKLKDFNRRRLQVLVEAGPDLLAFETIPNKLEAQVLSFPLPINIFIDKYVCLAVLLELELLKTYSAYIFDGPDINLRNSRKLEFFH